MVSDGVRERLTDIAFNAVHGRLTASLADSAAQVIVDALLESGEVRPTAHPSDSCDRHGIVTECRECGADIDYERDRYREALEQISERSARQGSIMLDIARRALDNEPAAVPDRPEVSR